MLCNKVPTITGSRLVYVAFVVDTSKLEDKDDDLADERGKTTALTQNMCKHQYVADNRIT